MRVSGQTDVHTDSAQLLRQAATAGFVRRVNRGAVLDYLRRHGPVSRTQIARDLRMSLPTVMRIVQALESEGLVRSQGMQASTGGRPPSLIEFNGSAYAVIGIDLGGTKVLGTLADLSGHIQHEIYQRHSSEAPDVTPGENLDRLCDLIAELVATPRPAGQRLRGIGVGVPSIVTPETGFVHWAPGLGWRDLPLKRILSERFGLPVYVENDVNLAALGEMSFGAGRGATNLVFIAIGTGIGAGVIIGGSLYHGQHQAAGEIGYLVPGPQYLGRQYDFFGALESFASGKGVADRARQLLASRGHVVSNGQITAEDVFAAARAGEAWAQQVVDETVDYLGLAIANIGALLDPEVVILGGGVALSEDLLIQPIQRRLAGVIPHVPRILPSPLGRRAAALGAITLVLDGVDGPFVLQRSS